MNDLLAHVLAVDRLRLVILAVAKRVPTHQPFAGVAKCILDCRPLDREKNTVQVLVNVVVPIAFFLLGLAEFPRVGLLVVVPQLVDRASC